MNKQCGKCSKTVYPTEELKCLDKVWHKACFKCQVCNMTLNMKNYKGYNKSPYCNAHYPTTKHTVVADTPETRRIAMNTKIQSNIKYHEQFEKEKGTKISVTDDPETERLKKNMQVVSNVAYHNTLKTKEEMDQARPFQQENNSDHSQPRKQIGSIHDYDPMSNQQSPAPLYQQQPARNPAMFTPTPYSPPGQFSSQQRKIGSIADYDPMAYERQQAQYNPAQANQYNPAQANQNYPAQANQYNQTQANQYNQAQSGSMYTSFNPRAPPQMKQPSTYTSKAIYDYAAADEDEVSFMENDLILDCDPVDDGWMYGTVKRTGERGMLPSNYVERV